jgi:hypothetical protein
MDVVSIKDTTRIRQRRRSNLSVMPPNVAPNKAIGTERIMETASTQKAESVR